MSERIGGNVPDAAARSSFTKRASLVLLFGLLLTLVLIGRLIQLQIVEHDEYATESIDNTINTDVLPPVRGRIFDRNGVLLAGNRQVQSLAIHEERVENMDAFLSNLREFVVISERDEELFHSRLKEFHTPGESIVLKQHLTMTEESVLLVNRHRFPQIEIKTEFLRHYPLQELTAHAVGSVRRKEKEDLNELDLTNYSKTEFIGRQGVEKAYENSLHGSVGFRKVEKNVHGRVMNEIDIVTPRRGEDLTLYLDHQVQRAAYDALGDRRGAIVALDPTSGGVLALVSKPSYDPNLFVMGLTDESYQQMLRQKGNPLFNRATRGTYAPGSTFKPIVALAGLTQGVTNWEYEIYDADGTFQLPNSKRKLRDWTWTKNGSGGHGWVDLYRAIYRSSNIYFFDIGEHMEMTALAEFAEQFGYGKTIAADILDLDPGVVPSPEWKDLNRGESWYPGDNMNFVIGQGFLEVTPFQMATVATVLANRGRIVRPRMVGASTGSLPQADQSPIGQVQGPTSGDWEGIVLGMRSVVHRGFKGYRQNGTAWAHIGMDIGYEMAGKSGTSQVVQIAQDEEYDEESLPEEHRKHALFIAFAPVFDPVIAVAVIIENGGGGSSEAGPVARAVIDAYMGGQLAQVDG